MRGTASDDQSCSVTIRIADGCQRFELPSSRDLIADIEIAARMSNCWIAAPVSCAESGAPE